MLLEKLNKDMVIAIKAKDQFRLDVIRMMKTQIQVGATAEKPIPEVEAVSSYYKKLLKSIEMPEIQAKTEFIEKLKRELKVIEEYLPKQATKEELEQLIAKHLSLGNMGAIMKAVKTDIEATGQSLDGKMVSELVKAKLAAK